MEARSSRLAPERHYYAVKKAIDDRALNRHVWDTFVRELQGALRSRPLRVLDLGAGIGTTVERFVAWGLFQPGVTVAEERPGGGRTSVYVTTIDANATVVDEAIERLPKWGRLAGFTVTREGSMVHLVREGLELDVEPRIGDALDFLASSEQEQRYDAVTANAFLDLLDLGAALPVLLRALRPSGLCYFSINFDGATVLEPPLDPELDLMIERLYHATMDHRIIGGKPSGDSRTGRRLYHALRAAGVDVLDLGGSDWVVFPRREGYLDDDAFFLHHIVDTIDAALKSNAALNRERFRAWIAERHRQIDRDELLYIAHNVDVTGRLL